MATIADTIAECVDLDALLAAVGPRRVRAAQAHDTAASGIVPAAAQPGATLASTRTPPRRCASASRTTVGFYYADDLEALQAAGAELVSVDALRDTALPELDGLFIGGGFPEALAARLAGNVALRHALRERIDAGLPVYAECGGLMYLARSITWRGERHEMVGAIPA